jgi:hypothetical protein
MDMQATRSRFGPALLVGLVTIVAAFAGSASISDRSVATRDAPASGKALTAPVADDPPAQADAPTRAAEGAAAVTPAGRGGIRKRVRCAGCGVVESVRRVERLEVVAGVCSTAGIDGHWTAHGAPDSGEYRAAATLADTLVASLETKPRARIVTVTSGYRIVIRFHDGSHQVFDEASARTLQSGERIQVIAGADLPAH